MNLRAAAAYIIDAVRQGASLTEVLPQHIQHFSDPRDQAFLQALSYGVCRWYERLNTIVNFLLEKPLKEKDQLIQSLLLVGVYQLTDMRVPPHAAVAETVAAAKTLKKMWAKGLINAVLRNYQRRAPEITAHLQQVATATYAHPQWLIDAIKQDWPNDWQTILTANNQHPPLSLRVNLQHVSRAAYLTTLAAQQLDAQLIPETQAGISLTQAVDVEQLPGFNNGDVSVQDGAAQLAAELIAAAPGDRILDACAAPGGKAAHILESQPHLKELVALDYQAHRLLTVKETLQRLQLSATVKCADAGAVAQWWDGQLFDRILLDAPCSATGVIRRHPDIKLLRRATDITQLAQEQLRLLQTLWPLLKKAGLFVYATCSILSAENTRVLTSFLATQQDAREEKISASWGKTCAVGQQILPGMHGMDGFYFVCLRKKE